ncbi:MAG: hypothetical protein KAS73_13745 [Candidatus Sabulitectum sp.]|nr:hypothetical protein [Candidatus Sabulitectum sp.]
MTATGGIIARAAYTGVESSVSWTETAVYPVVGIAVYGDYLFACNAQQTPDNTLIYSIDPDGSIDYDGEFVWIHPEGGDLFKCEYRLGSLFIEQSHMG